MEAKYFDTFCPYCDKEVRAYLITRRETHCVRGEDIVIDATVAVCPLCGEDIGDSRIDGPTIDRAFDIYRKRHGIPGPDELKALRAAYGMSIREFSRFLGFGEQTYASYACGSLPDLLHNRMIKLASTREGARLLIPLAEEEGLISEKSLKLARAFAYPEEQQDGTGQPAGKTAAAR